MFITMLALGYTNKVLCILQVGVIGKPGAHVALLVELAHAPEPECV